MNKEKLKGYWEKVKTALGKVSKKIWILIAAILVVVVAAVIIFFATRPYSPLISGATDEETATVLTWLQEQGVSDYRMQGSGTIMVPEGQASSLKARLLQEKYSANNSGYNGYFEMVGALSTSADRSQAKLTTLQNVMNATIGKFDGVRVADVTINPGEDNGYVLDTNKVVNASASVLLTMENGKLLSAEQANAIRNYISHSVAGLKVSDVSIVDTKGNIYDSIGASSGESAADASALKIEVERYWQNKIRNEVEQLLEGTFGEENVHVAVNTTVELGEKTINKYEVELPEFAQGGDTNGEGIVGSKFWSWQVRTDDEILAGGVVGTPSNSNLPNYVENGESVEGLLGRLAAEGSIEFDNNKTQTTMVITAATLTDVTVGVTINSTTATVQGPLDTDTLVRLVGSSCGIKAPLELPDNVTQDDYLSRYITVLVTPFYVAPAPEPAPGFLEMLEQFGIPSWVFIAAIVGLVLFAAVLVVVIMLVRKGKRKKEEEQRALEEMMAAAMTQQPGDVELGPDGQPVEPQPVLDENGNPVSGADVMDLHTERSMELRQSIRDFVDENMEVAALLIKSWLKEDGNNG